MERKEIAGIYCRLSQDDGSTGESGSIQTQKTLLTQYCQKHQIEIGGYYCDDGWSGTNFDRPDFKRMLEDIEAGKINRFWSRTCPDSDGNTRRWDFISSTTLKKKESVSSRWRKTSTPKMAQIIWSCPLPMSSIPSTPAKPPPKPKQPTVPEPKLECIWAPGHPSGISRIPMTGIT